MTKTQITQNHLDYTDKYFPRAREILEQEAINPLVRYQVFARQDLPKLEGVDETVSFVKDVTGDKARVYALRDGQPYQAKEPIMKIEGRVQDLIDLETVYLSILSGRLTGEVDMDVVRANARAIKQAAQGKPVYDFSARHFAPEIIEQIARICKEVGFAGTSTDVGAQAWNAKGMGTIPHALILAYQAHLQQQGIEGNPTVESMIAFDKHVDEAVPRVQLIDTLNREITDSIETKLAVPSLAAVRVDTCGENYAQGEEKIALPYGIQLPVEQQKHMRGKGVKITGVWALRRGLDEARLGDLEIVVSSGFNAKKTQAFMEADKVYQQIYGRPLFGSIGTGSFYPGAIMTTSDIVAYFDENKGLWLPNSKVGRAEMLTEKLEEVK